MRIKNQSEFSQKLINREKVVCLWKLSLNNRNCFILRILLQYIVSITFHTLGNQNALNRKQGQSSYQRSRPKIVSIFIFKVDRFGSETGHGILGVPTKTNLCILRSTSEPCFWANREENVMVVYVMFCVHGSSTNIPCKSDSFVGLFMRYTDFQQICLVFFYSQF